MADRDVTRDLAAKTETEVDGVFYDRDGPDFDTLPKAQSWIYRPPGACALLADPAPQAGIPNRSSCPF